LSICLLRFITTVPSDESGYKPRKWGNWRPEKRGSGRGSGTRDNTWKILKDKDGKEPRGKGENFLGKKAL